MSTIVPRCGFNRSMALAIRYGPRSHGGAGFTELITEQDHGTITMALKHLRTPTFLPGHTLRILLSWVQAYHGVSSFVWSDPNLPLPSFPAPWVDGVRTALRRLKGHIILPSDDPIMLQPLRENDVYFMDKAMDYSDKNETLDRINSCQSFLQVVTLADITNGHGTRILLPAKIGDEFYFRTLVVGKRFNQQRPASFAWKTWKTFLETTFETNRGLLRTPLRRWTQPISKCRWRQLYVFHPASKQLYRYIEPSGYVRLIPLTETCFYYDNATPADPESDCYPVKAFKLHQMVSIMRTFVPPQPTATTIMHLTFDTLVSQLEPWERTLLEHHMLLLPPEEVVAALNVGTFHVATDGSVIDQKASSGFVIASSTSECLVSGRGPAAGVDPTSFRAELLYDALAASCLLHRLSEFTGVPLLQPYWHYLDSQSAINHLTREEKQTGHFANYSLSPDWDIIYTTASVTVLLPPHDFIWTKGHQDKDVPRNELLSLRAKLNCEADDKAGLFQSENQARPTVPMTPNTKAQLLLNDITITSHYKYRIREATTLPRYLTYIQVKYKWDDITNKTIDWHTYKQIIKPHQRTHGNTLTKHVHEITPTGHIANRNRSHLEACCPACNCISEDNDHVLQCPAQSRSTWRAKTLQSINSNETLFFQDPVLLDILRDGLQRWLQDLDPIQLADYPPAAYSQLILNQNRIGWSHLFRGRWSHHWKRHHSDFASEYGGTGDHADGTRWVRRIGRKLLGAWFDLWTIRNKERPGKEKEEQIAKRRGRLKTQLEELLYQLKSKVCPAHRKLFCANVATHTETRPDLDGMEDWINNFGESIKNSVKERREIRRYFFQQGDLPG